MWIGYSGELEFSLDMQKLKLIYEGKAKKLFDTDDPELLIQEFKDDATAFDATKRGTVLLYRGGINYTMTQFRPEFQKTPAFPFISMMN